MDLQCKFAGLLQARCAYYYRRRADCPAATLSARLHPRYDIDLHFDVLLPRAENDAGDWGNVSIIAAFR